MRGTWVSPNRDALASHRYLRGISEASQRHLEKFETPGHLNPEMPGYLKENTGCLRSISKIMRCTDVSKMRHPSISLSSGCFEGISKNLMRVETSSRITQRCLRGSFRAILPYLSQPPFLLTQTRPPFHIETSSRLIQRSPPVY